jgi:hypothetical protein
MGAHFNFQGEADRFAPKVDFFTSQLKVALTVIGLSVLTEVLLLITPARSINLPNREYWMAPERRDIFMDRISSFVSMTFGTILLVILAGLELSVLANLQQPVVFKVQLMFPVIVVAIVFDFIMLTVLTRSFQSPA